MLCCLSVNWLVKRTSLEWLPGYFERPERPLSAGINRSFNLKAKVFNFDLAKWLPAVTQAWICKRGFQFRATRTTFLKTTLFGAVYSSKWQTAAKLFTKNLLPTTVSSIGQKPTRRSRIDASNCGLFWRKSQLSRILFLGNFFCDLLSLHVKAGKPIALNDPHAPVWQTNRGKLLRFFCQNSSPITQCTA